MTTGRRRAGLVGICLVVLMLGLWLRGRSHRPPEESTEARSREQSDPPALAGDGRAFPVTFDQLQKFADDPLIAGLLDPAGLPIRDLEIVAGVIEVWQSNFPAQGNPVGENHEITAALTGRNTLKLELIPADHPAINRRGELCDRWTTPLFFHQLSGTRMELRSAGPDRDFYTADDLVWTP